MNNRIIFFLILGEIAQVGGQPYLGVLAAEVDFGRVQRNRQGPTDQHSDHQTLGPRFHPGHLRESGSAF
jgi:hypothetical protein